MTMIYQNLLDLKGKTHATSALLLCLVVFPGQQNAHANAVQWLAPKHAGIDHDRDGIRDDVAITVRKTYKKSADRHWAMEIARSGQRFVVSDGNPFAVYRAQAEMQRAMSCLSRYKDNEDAVELRNSVLRLVLDTQPRQRAFADAVSKWEEDIRHRKLPSKPDDRWDDGCGAHGGTAKSAARTVLLKPGQAHTLSPRTDLTEPVILEANALPPPNFFLTGDIPAPRPRQQSAKGRAIVKKQTTARQADTRNVEKVKKYDMQLPDFFIVKDVAQSQQNTLPGWARLEQDKPVVAETTDTVKPVEPEQIKDRKPAESREAYTGLAPAEPVYISPADIPGSPQQGAAEIQAVPVSAIPEVVETSVDETSVDVTSIDQIGVDGIIPENVAVEDIPPEDIEQAVEQNLQASKPARKELVVTVRLKNDNPEAMGQELPPELQMLMPYIKSVSFEQPIAPEEK